MVEVMSTGTGRFKARCVRVRSQDAHNEEFCSRSYLERQKSTSWVAKAPATKVGWVCAGCWWTKAKVCTQNHKTTGKNTFSKMIFPTPFRTGRAPPWKIEQPLPAWDIQLIEPIKSPKKLGFKMTAINQTAVRIHHQILKQKPKLVPRAQPYTENLNVFSYVLEAFVTIGDLPCFKY